jgi:hypothetical protein
MDNAEASQDKAVDDSPGWVEDDHHLECVFDFNGSVRVDSDRACMAVRQGQVLPVPLSSSGALASTSH